MLVRGRIETRFTSAKASYARASGWIELGIGCRAGFSSSRLRSAVGDDGVVVVSRCSELSGLHGRSLVSRGPVGMGLLYDGNSRKSGPTGEDLDDRL